MSVIEDRHKFSAYEITKAFYEQPYPRKFKDLIDVLGIKHGTKHALETKFSNCVKSLECSGRVKHVIIKDDELYLPRDPDLENELRSKFNLRAALVVDIASIGTPEGHPSTHTDAWNVYDDKIHWQLGVWGGRLLSSVLRSGDTIATGGGRGPFSVSRNCFSTGMNRHRGDVVALTGQMSAHAWKEDGVGRFKEPIALDADFVASWLHSYLCTKGKPRLLSCKITERRSPPVTKDVNVAVIGIGALGGGHRLKKYQNVEDVKEVEELLDLINTKAESFEKAIDSKSPPFYHPVGDVCNYCFVVEPEPNHQRAKEWRELDRLVQQLNKKFLNTTPDALAEIAAQGIVLAVAGGPHKLTAIKHVLKRGSAKPWITHLVTDHLIARALLKS